MKNFFSKLLLFTALTLCVFGAFGTFKPKPKLTPQRAATHFITYVKKDKQGDTEELGSCTGTAVGPHALLTAVHCDEGRIRKIRLDYSVRTYTILEGFTDGRDHVIYILDGPAFKNYVKVLQRTAVIGDVVTSYGDGHRDFPPHTYTGRVVEDSNGGDQSDVDAAVNSTVFTLPVIPGDSGSAVYDKDHNIVALVTYGSELEDGSKQAVGFALDFPQSSLDEAYNLKETVNNGYHDSTPSTSGDSGADGSDEPTQ